MKSRPYMDMISGIGCIFLLAFFLNGIIFKRARTSSFDGVIFGIVLVPFSISHLFHKPYLFALFLIFFIIFYKNS